MSKNSKKVRRNINKVLRLVVAAFIATSLGAIGVAVAQTSQALQNASCPNHAEHDDTCGYGAAAEEISCDMDCETASDGVIVHVEGCAYTATTEGSDCAHSCELCDLEGVVEIAESAEDSEDLGESEQQQALITTLSNGDVATYEINQETVSFTLTKTLSAAADSDETFVFQITDINGNSFYATLTVAEGETSASVKVVDLTPGEYTVRELNTNWRYTLTGDMEQTDTLNDPDGAYSFTFASSKVTSQWVSGSVKATNTMGEQ